MIAAGLSGPRRPYAGAARDFVLGVRLLTAERELLRFGGQVMKNVAGFDVSRLLCGSLGVLGIITEVSLKVLPRPRLEQTLRLELSAAAAVESFNRLVLLGAALCMVYFGFINFVDGFHAYRMPSLTPLASLYAPIPLSGLLVALFAVEQLVNGWRHGFAGPSGIDDRRHGDEPAAEELDVGV